MTKIFGRSISLYRLTRKVDDDVAKLVTWLIAWQMPNQNIDMTVDLAMDNSRIANMANSMTDT